MFQKYKRGVLSLAPSADERDIRDEADFSVVAQWDDIMATSRSNLPVYLRECRLQPRAVTGAVTKCISAATQSMKSRLDAAYRRVAARDDTLEGAAADSAVLEALQAELLEYRRISGL
jgi:hypothetical protein